MDALYFIHFFMLTFAVINIFCNLNLNLFSLVFGIQTQFWSWTHTVNTIIRPVIVLKKKKLKCTGLLRSENCRK